MVGDSFLPVAWVFLSSCGVLVSSSQVSVGALLWLWWVIISSCGVAAPFYLWCAGGLLSRCDVQAPF